MSVAIKKRIEATKKLKIQTRREKGGIGERKTDAGCAGYENDNRVKRSSKYKIMCGKTM